MSEIKKALFSHQAMIVLLYKEAFLNTNKFDSTLPSSILCRNMRMSFLRKHHMVYLQSEGLSIKLILYPVQPFQID